MPVLRLLYCHYVFADQRKKFDSILRYLQSIGEFVSTDQVLDVLHGRSPLLRNSFHLSFDDGLKNVVVNALPILRDRGIPAILFVPTALVSTPNDKCSGIRRILATGNAKAEIVTWSDLEAARAAGFDVGSHTRTHARLSGGLSCVSDVEHEVFGSKADIERQLGAKCSYMSWPFGGLQDVDDDVLDVIKNAGYKACFGAFRGRIQPGVTNVFCIPRHHFEPEWPLSHVKCFALGAWELGR